MADLSQLKDEISELSTVTDAVGRLIDALVQKIQELGTGGVSQEDVDALVSEIQANKQALVDAIASVPHPDNTLPGEQGQGRGGRGQ